MNRESKRQLIARSPLPAPRFTPASILFTLLLLISACAPSRLAVYSRPGGAEVYVDDRLLARTINEVEAVKVDLKPGQHQVRVEREGYYPWTRQVEVVAMNEVSLLADLAEIPPPPHHVPVGALEIRVDPGGARLSIDGRDLGAARPRANEPIKVENLAPGKYRLHAELPGYENADGVYEIFAAQTTRAIFTLQPLTPYYQYPTNDDLLRQAVKKAIRGLAYLPGMKSTKSIALVNLAGDAGDEPLRNLLEDLLIAELAQNGRPVAERENHLLVRLANEAARGDSLVLDVLTRHASDQQPFLYDARLRSAAEALAVVTPDRESGPPRQIMIRDARLAAPAMVPTADQILGYRLVEKIMRIDTSPYPGQKEPMLRREAVIRIYVRLINARNGIVEWAERFEASVADQVPVRVYARLAEPPERFYAYGEKTPPPPPAVATAPANAIQTITPAPEEADALFWYFRHMGELNLRGGDNQGAAESFQEAVRFRPADYETRMLYAESLLREGDLRKASREYRAAIKAIFE